jgi:cobalt transporter subunit CbtA
MIRIMVTSALAAGIAAWALAALLHFAFVQKYLLLSEDYETGTLVHFGAAPAHDEGARSAGHDDGEEPGQDDGAVTGHHGAGGDDAGRDLWTTVFFGLVYVAYAMILVAGFGLARAYGQMITAREGLIWGIAGFVAFQMAPAMGLAPMLPGTLAADLGERQLWWWATVAATAAGLGLFGYGRALLGPIVAPVLGLALLAAPHVIGAPMVEGFSGSAPPEVSGTFAARVLGTGLAVWALMGWVAGFVWAREADKPA